MGTMRPVRLPMRSTTGLVICLRPLNRSTLPNRATVSPSASWRSRHAWLKNVTRRVPLSSRTSAVTSTLGGRPRVRRDVVRTTVTSTIASSPTTRSRMRASLVRST